MALIGTDMNLLFGLLALQSGLIDQAALVDAFQSWTRDKGRSLGEYLVERGDLDATDRGAVVALVECYLKRHGGDPERSLVSLPIGARLREGLNGVSGQGIGDTIGEILGVSLCAAVDAESALGATLTIAPTTAGGSRFAFLRPHARGGLGQVCVALDAELNREVALKEIQPEFADDPRSRSRFLLEAELTGRLEHPGVVPVYGLGANSQGRPYYAMRFIRGDSMKQALDRFHAADQDQGPGRDRSERALALRGLLGRFVSACQAVAYAHSRGVIHRDIKPANIMLGPYGETLVVDWGLAKVIGRDDSLASAEATLRPSGGSGSSETQAGTAIGTPAYMSPEQADGRLDAIGPASDVYSLGATLYCLLTGRAPIKASHVGEMLQAAQQGEFPTPRSANPRVPAGLEAIIRKAMAIRPADRYPSPAVLAEDVEHWLADEPVAAYPDPAAARLARWARRNKSAVAGAATLLIAAVFALSVGTILLGRANARTESERDLAVKNFRLARQAVDDYLTQVGQSPILKDQGHHELRQDLLKAALHYYQDFLAQCGDDPTLRLDAAESYGRVGLIEIETGQPAAALVAYKNAIALLDALQRDQPGDRKVDTTRVGLLADRLRALRDAGQLQEAADEADRIAADQSRLLAGRPEGDEMSAGLARYFYNAAMFSRQAGRPDGGVPHALRAVVLGEAHLRAHPDDLNAARTLMYAYSVASHNLHFAGRLDDATSYGRRASEYAEAQAQAHPSDLEIRMTQSSIYHVQSNISKARGQQAEAIEWLGRALKINEAIIGGHPSLVRPRVTRANIFIMLSQIQADLGQLDEAEASARQVITLGEALTHDIPTSVYIRMTIGYGQAALGKVLLKRGDFPGAIRSLRLAVEQFESSNDGADKYNAACSLALASTIDDPAEGPEGPARRGRDADRAVAMLRLAFNEGYAGFDEISMDPDLASIRPRDDYQAILRQMEARAKSAANPTPPK